VATSISIVAVSLMRTMQVYLILKIHAYSWSYLKIVGVSAISALIGLIVQKLLQTEHYLLLIAATSAAIIVVYALLTWGIGFEEADKVIIKKIQRKLKLFVK
jgi:hypothetical protein